MKLKFIFNDLKLFYKIVNGLVPISLPEYISVVGADHARYTRRTAAIVDHIDATTFSCSIVPNCDSFRNSYFYRTIRVWNNVPVQVRQATGISIFKSKLIKFLWSADTEWPD